MTSAGQKAAQTKRARYGARGLTEIAQRAYRTRLERRVLAISALDRHLARSAGGAMRRAQTMGLEYEEDLAGWAIAMMTAQHHRCALSGVSFDLAVHGRGAAPRPYAPSIDRIDATCGYTCDNIRIVCWAVNLLLGTWGEEPALRIARGIATRAE